MVNPVDDDPVQRWQAIVDFYTEFTARQGWEFLQPLITLTSWIRDQPLAGKLFPHTSLAALCASLLPGYNPDLPFISVSAEADGQFRFNCLAAVGKQTCTECCSTLELTQMFSQFVALLESTQ